MSSSSSSSSTKLIARAAATAFSNFDAPGHITIEHDGSTTSTTATTSTTTSASGSGSGSTVTTVHQETKDSSRTGTGTGTGTGPTPSSKSFFLNKERDHPRPFKDLGKSNHAGRTDYTNAAPPQQQKQQNQNQWQDSHTEPHHSFSSSNLFSPSRWLFHRSRTNANANENETQNDDTRTPTNKKQNRRDKRDKDPSSNSRKHKNYGTKQRKPLVIRVIHRFIDPALLDWIATFTVGDRIGGGGSSTTSSSSSTSTSTTSSSTIIASRNISETLTQLADKVLTSTPRLLSLANLLLSVTYLLHSAVVALFLGEASSTSSGDTTNTNTNATRRGTTTGGADVGNANAADPAAGTPLFEIGGVGASTSNRIHRSGRERLGGYLLFKLLLISAVVDPDTLDLLILLSWYTLLSFLRSLAYLAGVTTAHASASGQAPRRGVLKLLLAVLVCDLTAAGVCAALFHGAGWGMVLLLSCDCALLALDILTHVARYGQQVIDEMHQIRLAEMEANQIQLHETWRNYNRQNGTQDSRQNTLLEEDESALDSVQDEDSRADGDLGDFNRASRQMDHDMELLEAIHTRRLSLMDYTAFLFELFGLVLTTVHFVHIWSLHGVNFTLVDGVLALHLHSAISATGKKISERRNHNRIVRDLDNYFEDATELELSKACATGDVCCICLGTMSIGNVKKVGCGHLFHSHCLREVVERARSIEAAKCPLCRASLIDGKQISSHMQSNVGSPLPFIFGPATNDRGLNATGREDEAAQQGERIPVEGENNNANRVPIPVVPNNQDERALFRFSTEGILPAWLPIPAFSFEVVRRTPMADDPNRTEQPAQQQESDQQGNIAADQNNAIPAERQGGPSFWRRVLILTGAISMSPEEEAITIAQLVDMFPQYDRADLLRALRQHGSSEAVADSILNGSFLGAARGGSLTDVAEPRRVQQEGTWDPIDLY